MLLADVPLLADETLDSWFRRFCAAQGRSPQGVLQPLGYAPRHLVAVPPDQALVTAIAKLSRQPAKRLQAATIAAWISNQQAHGIRDGRSASRGIAYRFWGWNRHTQACLPCLTEHGYWRLNWRSAHSTACTEHRQWLTSLCPVCRHPFQTGSGLASSFSTGPDCGNGSRHQRCPLDLQLQGSGPETVPPHQALHAQADVDAALAEGRARLVGKTVNITTWLAETRSLAALRLNLDRPDPDRRRLWLNPPYEQAERSEPVRLALQVTNASSWREAQDLFATWPFPTEGNVRRWAQEHTATTPAVARLVQTLPTGRNPRLRTPAGLPRQAVNPVHVPLMLPPVLIPADTLGRISRCRVSETTRAFLSLALVKETTGSTWRESATLLGRPADYGHDLSRTSVRRLRDDDQQMHQVLLTCAGVFNEKKIDYRKREHDLTASGLPSRDTFLSWASQHRPGMRYEDAPHLLTALWLRWACAPLALAPEHWRVSELPRHQRATSRRIASELTPAAVDAAAALLQP